MLPKWPYNQFWCVKSLLTNKQQSLLSVAVTALSAAASRSSCHTSLSKCVKGSLICLLALFASACMSSCASRCFLDFRRGLLTWNQRETSQFFFLSVCLGREKKKKKSCSLLLFLVPAESIKPAHQLGNADSYRPWIIKRSWSTSSDGGQERDEPPEHHSCICAIAFVHQENNVLDRFFLRFWGDFNPLSSPNEINAALIWQQYVWGGKRTGGTHNVRY